MSSLLIKNGYLITMDVEARQFSADILILGDKIQKIGQGIDEASDKMIDASGMLVLPGFVQAHIHLCQSLFRGQADDQNLLQWLVAITTLESQQRRKRSMLPPAWGWPR